MKSTENHPHKIPKSLYFNAGPIWIEKEQLPHAAGMSTFWEPPQIIRDAPRLQLGEERWQVLPPERDVVEDAAAVGDSGAFDDV